MLKFIDGDKAGALAIWEKAAADDPVNAHDLEPWLERARGTAPAPAQTDGGALNVNGG
jgi:hypothetical protein